MIPSEVQKFFNDIEYRFSNRGAKDFQVVPRLEGEYCLTWLDPETGMNFVLSVSVQEWQLSADLVMITKRGFGYPPEMEEVISAFYKIDAAWIDEFGEGTRTPVDYDEGVSEQEGQPASRMLTALGISNTHGFSFAKETEEKLSPLHRFYQERNIPGDPHRLAAEMAVQKVFEKFKKVLAMIRLVDIQFERIEVNKYAGADKHIERGKVYLKAHITAGPPPLRRATLSFIIPIKNGEASDAVYFIDASKKRWTFNEKSIKKYLNLHEFPRRSTVPRVERALIDRTLLEKPVARSLFHGRGSVEI